MDQRQRGAGQRGDSDGSGEDERPGGMNALDGPEARHGTHQHHPLDTEVEDARASASSSPSAAKSSGVPNRIPEAITTTTRLLFTMRISPGNARRARRRAR